MSTSNMQLEYVKNFLLNEILSNFKEETLQNFELVTSTGLNGFMSEIYTLKLNTKLSSGEIKEYVFLAKFMKGDETFRKSSKSYIQFENEILVYAKVIPAFKKLLNELNVSDVLPESWIAPAYVTKFGYIEGLSTTPADKESVLVLEHLGVNIYKMGPRLHLQRNQLLGAFKPIAQYHAMSYCLRILKPDEFERLRSSIIPLPFCIDANDVDDAKTNIYNALYRVAFDRFFDFYDRKGVDCIDKKTKNGAKLLTNIKTLRDKYFEEPTKLLQYIYESVDKTEDDRCFAAILHGDYNRNNILFRYKPRPIGDGNNDEEEVDTVKMIDFQELRYGTPAIDLSFIMYMNTPPELREKIWLKMLQTYHGHMIDTLTKVMAGASDGKHKLQQILDQYSFDRFNTHFSQYAIYGVLVCLHFLPWLLCSSEECAQISHLFETNMHGAEFHKLSMEIGGDDVNFQLFNIVRHASEMGYLDHI